MTIAPSQPQVTKTRTALHKNKWVHLAVGIAVSVVCLWYAVGLLKDPNALQQIGQAFARANYLSLPVIWFVLAIFYWLKAWRWRLLLKPVGDFRPVRDLLPPTMIGFAFNNLLPAHLGDFVRVFLFAQQRQLNKTAVLSSVVLERVFDIVAILFYLGLGLVFVPGLDPSVKQTALVFAAAAGCCVLGGLIYVIWTRPFVALVEWVLARLPFVPAGLRRKLTGMLEAGADGLASLKNPRLIVGIMLTSWAQWALNGVLVYLSLWSFGVHVSPLVACIVLGVVAFGVTVPSSPGYFGVIQLCFMSVLKLFPVNQADVFAASVYYHMSQYIPVTLIGLYFFYKTGLKIRDVEDAQG
ncbi:MAG: lysylphosphatidylglycerol synthase transmembrane domain-containing protein [Planctomycetaceae bacterium]|nr:lysylphosphatidylglycerol synthase transmembrane domain-containing protein [Planctomycetaceae bacterium]